MYAMAPAAMITGEALTVAPMLMVSAVVRLANAAHLATSAWVLTRREPSVPRRMR